MIGNVEMTTRETSIGHEMTLEVADVVEEEGEGEGEDLMIGTTIAGMTSAAHYLRTSGHLHPDQLHLRCRSMDLHRHLKNK